MFAILTHIVTASILATSKNEAGTTMLVTTKHLAEATILQPHVKQQLQF